MIISNYPERTLVLEQGSFLNVTMLKSEKTESMEKLAFDPTSKPLFILINHSVLCILSPIFFDLSNMIIV